MKIWYLDNEYTDYIIIADSEEEAWSKMRRIGILRPDEEEIMSEDGTDQVAWPAYNGMYEAEADEDGTFSFNKPHDTVVVP